MKAASSSTLAYSLSSGAVDGPALASRPRSFAAPPPLPLRAASYRWPANRKESSAFRRVLEEALPLLHEFVGFDPGVTGSKPDGFCRPSRLKVKSTLRGSRTSHWPFRFICCPYQNLGPVLWNLDRSQHRILQRWTEMVLKLRKYIITVLKLVLYVYIRS
jgi:hypothetical protein